ncbi:MAG: glycosyltransferase [Candidatus Melainabacteria bacterium]|nr:glycosyltransferase [Candidatus Melainabacteria bacterium]
MKISFAICTYNRLSYLKLVTEDFFKQCEELRFSLEAHETTAESEFAIQSLEIEFLFIDNNSDDGTGEYCKLFAGRFNFQDQENCKNTKNEISINHCIGKVTVAYIFEKRQGLSHARNAAIEKFTGEYLVFLDDDIRLADSFLLNLLVNLNKSLVTNVLETASLPFIASVRIVPEWESEKPEWLSFKPPFALSPSVFPSHDYGSESRTYPFVFENLKVANPIGAVMLISRSVFEKIGIFNTELGVGSSALGFGLHEDTEFFRTALKEGVPLYYWGDTQVAHPVTKQRMSGKYICDWYFKSGKSLTWLAFNRADLFENGQAEMIGMPVLLTRKLPKKIKQFLSMRVMAIPVYLILKLLSLMGFSLLSYLSFNFRTIIYFRALMMKCLGEISAFRILH